MESKEDNASNQHAINYLVNIRKSIKGHDILFMAILLHAFMTNNNLTTPPPYLVFD
jgi:hypothetical protein